MTIAGFAIEAGTSFPLGASWNGLGTNFALFSANATKVELCLFDDRGRREIARVPLPEYTHEIWHGYLPSVRPGQLYGYRVHGPYAPEAGHRFNPNKFLLDPYALAYHGEIRWHDALFGYRVGHAREDLSFDRRDSAFVMPKCVVVDQAVTWGDDMPPRRKWSETVIYEAHVKGMTALDRSVPERLRGSFAGLAEPGVIDHLSRLGVTAVELMPIQAFFDDRHLVDRGLSNFWGYNTIGFFAPAPRYISPGSDVHEFKLMVRRLHEAGIEVILDVVYNHTAEGSHLGPTLSFRGIDNASYYIPADDPRYYYDTTGCGNTVNIAHQRVLQMVMDSLRFWVESCHVDGFRFDLASSLGRDRETFNPNAVFLDAVRQDPVLGRVKLIAEPWDTGPDGYQVGNFPPGWAEWNDQYRDGVRSYWKGDSGALPELSARLLGSSDRFERRGRRSWASVNFVTAHDGFTLIDTFSYNDKHNEANLEENRDGHSHNLSWNCGIEGVTDDTEVLDLRDRMRRAMISTLLVSQGTPMLLMGDEVGRSQGGNNNAYCQDNAMNWLEVEGADPRDLAFLAFTRAVIALRRDCSLFRQDRFLHGAPTGPEAVEVHWMRTDGRGMEDDDWREPEARALGMLLRDRERQVAVLFNSHFEPVAFAAPEGAGEVWRVMLDTAAGEVWPEARAVWAEGPVDVPARALLVLEARR